MDTLPSFSLDSLPMFLSFETKADTNKVYLFIYTYTQPLRVQSGGVGEQDTCKSRTATSHCSPQGSKTCVQAIV